MKVNITIPSNVTVIGQFAVGYTSYFELITDMEIYGVVNSAAEIYSTENKITFCDIKESLKL